MDDPHDSLREIIVASGRTIPEIADKAGVNEQALRRWVRRQSKSISLLNANLVAIELTGKPVTVAAKPARKQRRAA